MVGGANGLFFDRDNMLYVANVFGQTISRIDPESGEVVERLGRVLEAWYTGGPRPRADSGELDLDSLTPEELEQLRSLGYIQ